uniref:Putative arabinosyltransferase ARAD1 n=1 Tax=Rhizophora mucronata TaxID=61149 RepID=A0A2P2NZR6_RHIMU
MPPIPKKNTITSQTSRLQCSMPTFFLLLIILSLFFLSLFFVLSPNSNSNSSVFDPQNALQVPQYALKVYVADLPRSFNYGLLGRYWSSSQSDSRISSDPDHDSGIRPKPASFPPYPENPVIKQYSAEYWITGDLMTPENLRTRSFAKRVFDEQEADVVFVPFFATLSAEMELAKGKATFRKKEGNEDYQRQKEVVRLVTSSEAWKLSGGRDHVFVLTGCVKT